jgi:hypothetical protein
VLQRVAANELGASVVVCGSHRALARRRMSAGTSMFAESWGVFGPKKGVSLVLSCMPCIRLMPLRRNHFGVETKIRKLNDNFLSIDWIHYDNNIWTIIAQGRRPDDFEASLCHVMG